MLLRKLRRRASEPKCAVTPNRIPSSLCGYITADFRFTQNTAMLGSNTPLAGAVGAGADFYLNAHTALRAKADWIGTRVSSRDHGYFQVVTSLA